MKTDYADLGMHIVSGMTRPTTYSEAEHYIAIYPVKKDEYDGRLTGIGNSGIFKDLYCFKIQLTYSEKYNKWYLFYGYENIYSVQRSSEAEGIFRLLKRIENAFERESNEGRYSHTEIEKISVILKALRIRYVIEEKRKIGTGGYDQNEYNYMTTAAVSHLLKEKMDNIVKKVDSKQ